ncbi:MAG: WecB/TagA/CpsF family glycosyltransferase [Granulosicoccus sp.]
MDSIANIPQRHQLLGFFVHPGTLPDYLLLIRKSIENNEQKSVLYHNLHSLYSYFTASELRRHYEGTTVLVDGMPLIWLMQLCKLPVSRDHRLTYVDFIMPMMQQAAEQRWNVFHIGQHSSVQNAALERIRAECPGISINGHDGFFDQTPNSKESLAVVDAINKAETNLLLVGFGAPKQEAWLAAHRHLINAQIAFTCGACMEYVAGHVKTPPRWMGRMGLEWSFRLLENPRRFAFRYLVEPIVLGAILLRNGLVQLRSNKHL